MWLVKNFKCSHFCSTVSAAEVYWAVWHIPFFIFLINWDICSKRKVVLYFLKGNFSCFILIVLLPKEPEWEIYEITNILLYPNFLSIEFFFSKAKKKKRIKVRKMYFLIHVCTPSAVFNSVLKFVESILFPYNICLIIRSSQKLSLNFFSSVFNHLFPLKVKVSVPKSRIPCH